MRAVLWITAISITHQAIRCTLVSPPLPAPRRTRSGAVHSAEPEGVGQNYIYARMDIASQRPAGVMCPQTSLAASTAYKPYDISVSHDSPRATVRDTGYVHTRPSGLAVWVIPLRPSKINVHATCVLLGCFFARSTKRYESTSRTTPSYTHPGAGPGPNSQLR